MRAGIWLLAGLSMFGAAQTGAFAEDRLGIVLIHGKSGLPSQFTLMAETLSSRGYVTDTPEMCWSRNRIYDRPYLDCLNDIDAAVARVKTRGANGIVILGMSLGGNGALAYGARHTGLKGVITLVPGHAPEFISRRPEVAASLEQARALVTAGRGNTRTAFTDVNTRSTTFNFEVVTTPDIYLSFFAPNSPAVMPANAARLSAPLLYVAASNDPTQRGRGYIFDQAPNFPQNRYVTVTSDHIGTPAASIQIVLSWLLEIAGPGP